MQKEKLELIPQTTGIYKFLNSENKILYIGKAINLRSRVKSYFSGGNDDRPRIREMIPLIEQVEVIETNNEIESLVLESVLIKKHQPFFNSDLKDDKSHSWIYITTQDKFPTIRLIRSTDLKGLKKGKTFGPYPSSSATKRIFTYLRKIYPFCTCSKNTNKECMYFHIGLCPGPYQGHISEKAYKENIKGIMRFLNGKSSGHIQKLEKKMKEYSKEREYEKAQELRDRIEDLRYLSQKIDFEYGDTDISYQERRKGIIMDDFKKLGIELGVKNLRRIECYDISNTQGTDAYGSMVVAVDGEIQRNKYRIFKIRNSSTPDDPKMLKEVLERRFKPDNKDKYESPPDVVLIDGGLSQLSVLKDSIPSGILLMGISKGKRLKRGGSKQHDEFYIRVGQQVIRSNIENTSILIDLRDEAHRFAILHHRKARAKRNSRSELLNIPGIGNTRVKRLLTHFKGVSNIKKASVDEIDSIIKNKKTSKEVYKYFNPS